jgi:hypothetical protein
MELVPPDLNGQKRTTKRTADGRVDPPSRIPNTPNANLNANAPFDQSITNTATPPAQSPGTGLPTPPILDNTEDNDDQFLAIRSQHGPTADSVIAPGSILKMVHRPIIPAPIPATGQKFRHMRFI